MTAVLDYRAPMVIDGEPAQIVGIRPLRNAIVLRAIGVEARVLGVAGAGRVAAGFGFLDCDGGGGALLRSVCIA